MRIVGKTTESIERSTGSLKSCNGDKKEKKNVVTNNIERVRNEEVILDRAAPSSLVKKMCSSTDSCRRDRRLRRRSGAEEGATL